MRGTRIANHAFAACVRSRRLADVLLASMASIAWLAASAMPAHAYRTLADDPDIAFPARWGGGVIQLSILADTLAGIDPAADVTGAVSDAAAAWTATGCLPLTVELSNGTMSAAERGDGLNTLVGVAAGWEAMGFAADRAAVTDVQLVRYDDGTGEIVEFDVYLNLERFVFVTGDPVGAELDLQSVLTHELGHALGLLHVCEHADIGGAPDCASSDGFSLSVMHPDYRGSSGHLLGPDDTVGVCTLYGSDTPCPGLGSCSSECAETTDCAVGVCAISGASQGTCVAAASTGAECGAGEDCASGLCITSTAVGSYCTTECVDDAMCGAMESCARVDGRSVCAPSPQGCNAAPVSRRQPNNAPWVAGLLLSALAWRGGRRRGRS